MLQSIAIVRQLRFSNFYPVECKHHFLGPPIKWGPNSLAVLHDKIPCLSGRVSRLIVGGIRHIFPDVNSVVYEPEYYLTFQSSDESRFLLHDEFLVAIILPDAGIVDTFNHYGFSVIFMFFLFLDAHLPLEFHPDMLRKAFGQHNHACYPPFRSIHLSSSHS